MSYGVFYLVACFYCHLQTKSNRHQHQKIRLNFHRFRMLNWLWFWKNKKIEYLEHFESREQLINEKIHQPFIGGYYFVEETHHFIAANFRLCGTSCPEFFSFVFIVCVSDINPFFHAIAPWNYTHGVLIYVKLIVKFEDIFIITWFVDCSTKILP